MATLTNVAKTSGNQTSIARSIGDGIVFYGWLFFFTIPQFSHTLTNTAKASGTITNIAKS